MPAFTKLVEVSAPSQCISTIAEPATMYWLDVSVKLVGDPPLGV